MNTRSINDAAQVICDLIGRSRIPANIAMGLDASGWLNTTEAAAELERLRLLQNAQPADLSEAQIDALADAGNRALNDYYHDELCACSDWPESCGNYVAGNWDTAAFDIGMAAVIGRWEAMRAPAEAGESERLRTRIAELEAERHITNEALSDAAERLRQDRDRIAELETQVAAVDDLRIRAIDKGDQLRARVDEIERKYTFDTAKLRARVAELEAAAEQVAEFCAQRAEYVTNLRAFVEGGEYDYYRWSGHAEARRQLSQRLGLPVGWPAEDLPVVPTPATPVEDPHDSPLHHDYRTGRDLPEYPHA